ncbi:MAG: SDR family oxidoreductase [Acidimicrobiales bacterium]|nr:SDR family oxidoreductase [Acidimicrobiales bacterium]
MTAAEPMNEPTLRHLLDLAGRVAVVTGAGNGIGAASARRLAEAGAAVVLGDLDEAAADAVATELRQAGGSAAVAPTDVSDPRAGPSLVRAAIDSFGALDILVNAAGIFPHADALDVDPEFWDRIHDINLRGSFLVAQACGAHMLSSQGGAIVNIASRAATRPPRGMVAYATSKAGVVAMTRSLALELGPTVRVNAVAPGAITDTASARRAQEALVGPDGDPAEIIRAAGTRVPLGRTGRADEVARVVMFLVSDLASYVNGETVAIDGGDTIT